MRSKLRDFRQFWADLSRFYASAQKCFFRKCAKRQVVESKIKRVFKFVDDLAFLAFTLLHYS